MIKKKNDLRCLRDLSRDILMRYKMDGCFEDDILIFVTFCLKTQYKYIRQVTNFGFMNTYEHYN